MSTMVRLNTRIRDAVIAALLAKKYVKEDEESIRLREAMKEAKARARKMAYEEVFPQSIQTKMYALPEDYFPVMTYCNVRFYDPKDENNYSDETVTFGESMRVPFKAYRGNMISAVLPSNGKLAKALEKAREANREYTNFERELREKKRADRQRVAVVVNSVTTVKRLQEIWPEVVEFLPEEVSGPQGGVPAEMIASLNAEFGLSKD